ncbi:MAG TPA: NIPSNAP family protein [Cytophagales bacterium]|nr:NIPSNAP family protein [Cytophagales bacterium]HAA20646.1 NIPSNAP family protein [Cytophagales bacterium]HAP59383.1 NIPSNAP family protein [Cytophagales bacterium]
MVTCFLKYTIDPHKVDAFEQYGRVWIDLVNKMGGDHHGYLLPYEGANNIAYASFSFPSLAAYETYRKQLESDEECQGTLLEARENGCIISYERSFMRPVFEGLQGKTRL